MSSATETTTKTSEASGADRRRSPRYPFRADIEIVDAESGMKIMNAYTSDFSRGGCYVDMINPLPEATVVKLRMTKWQQTLEAEAKVVYSMTGMGMGLMFGVLDAAQGALLENWCAQLSSVQLC